MMFATTRRLQSVIGTNDDLVRLFDEAHKKGIKILLDLVPGHTSDQNEWFLEAKKAAKSEYSNRYIFTKSVWDAPPQYRMMCGLCERGRQLYGKLLQLTACS